MTIPVLANAGSGSGNRSERRFEAIEEAFRKRDLKITLERVDGEHLRDAAEKILANGASIIVAAGGDGTISAVAGALAGGSAALGVIPTGTLNHFAKDLGIPQNIKEAVDVIAERKVEKVDVGEVNGRVFINNSSIGLYPALVLERERSRHRKWIAMILAAYRVLRQVPGLSVTLETEELTLRRSTPFVFVGNNEYSTHLLAPGAREKLTDGKLHVFAADCKGRRCVLKTALMALLNRLHVDRDFDTFRVPEITVDSRRRHLYVSMDGEVVRLASPLEYRIRPAALNVILPPAGK